MIYILLPAYNEEKNIKNVVSGIAESIGSKEQLFFIIVDDGSTDGTKQIVERELSGFSVELISFDVNRGVGAVFRAGLKYIASRAGADDIIVSMDCDSSHSPEALPFIIARLREKSDIVIASRYHKDSKTVGLPLIRKIFSDIVNLMLRISFKCENARDFSTFYRGYRACGIQKAFELYGDDFIKQPGFSCMSEMLIKLSKLDMNISEVPITLRFDLRTGKSKMKIFATVFEYLKLMFSLFKEKIFKHIDA